VIKKEVKVKKPRSYVDDLLTKKIIGACYEVHNELGPGFVEKIYLKALRIALLKINLGHETEKEFWVSFDNEKVGTFRVDLVVENKVIVELKSIEGSLPKIFESQLISYLKAAKLNVGLLVNFGNRKCVIRRLVISP